MLLPYCPTWRVKSDGVPSIEPPGEIFEEARSLVNIEDDRSPGPGHSHQLTSPTEKIYTNTEHNKKSLHLKGTVSRDGLGFGGHVWSVIGLNRRRG
jgi:hypothetical protein